MGFLNWSKLLKRMKNNCKISKKDENYKKTIAFFRESDYSTTIRNHFYKSGNLKRNKHTLE